MCGSTRIIPRKCGRPGGGRAWRAAPTQVSCCPSTNNPHSRIELPFTFSCLYRRTAYENHFRVVLPPQPAAYPEGLRPAFLTFVTNSRRTLPPWARDIVLESCIHGHGTKYNLFVAVVMPDHAHLILTPLTDIKNQRIYPLHEVMRAMKSYSARRINERLGGSGRIWQQESFDHVLRSSESLDAKIAYVLANPVRAGLVSVPEEYPWVWTKPVSNVFNHKPTVV